MGASHDPTICLLLSRFERRAEEGYLDLLRVLEGKPFPTAESMIHVPRLMKAQNPKIGAVNLDELNDARLVKKLDDSGFIDKAFAAQGIKP